MGSCADWKLIYRDPFPTVQAHLNDLISYFTIKWPSKHAHIALIGHAAHSFLLTSVRGSSPAIEDGVTITTVLHFKRETPVTMLAYDAIRCDHVYDKQETGKRIWEM